jgi:hypothetical protein
VTKSHDQGYSSSESDNETAQEKKLRLAKQYLRHIEAEGKNITLNLILYTVIFV